MIPWGVKKLWPGWWGEGLGQYSACHAEDLSTDPQHPAVGAAHTRNPSTVGQRQGVRGAHLPVGLEELVGPKFTDRPCLKNKVVDNREWYLMSNFGPLHICVHTNTTHITTTQ